MKLIICILLILTVTQGLDIYTSYSDLADQIVGNMTLEQKIGQTTQVDFIYLNDDQGKTNYAKIQTYNLGSVLVGGNGCPDDEGNISADGDCLQANNAAWKNTATQSNDYAINVEDDEGKVVFSIKPLLGTDAVHGNQHAVGEVLFPHNIGLAATFNEDNFANAAYWNKVSVLESGYNFVFGPTVAVSHNPQWGRFYETLGIDDENVQAYAQAYVNSLQEIEETIDEGVTSYTFNGVLASVKHFLGDGATYNGHEEGNDVVVNDEGFETFWNHNSQGYQGAIKASAGNIMVSYSAINDVPMSIHPYVNSRLKADFDADTNPYGLGFTGFVISDYNSVWKAAYQGLPTTNITMEIKDAYYQSFINGVDMQMISGDVEDYQNIITELALDQTLGFNTTLDAAVKRIIQVKLAMGLIDIPETIAQQLNYKKQDKKITNNKKAGDSAKEDALKAAQESLVLLKNDNDNVLPVTVGNIKNVILLGDRYVPVDGGYQLFQDYDNIGAQNGGWTIRWQGYNGNKYWQGDNKVSSGASSILEQVTAQFPEATIFYPEYSDPTDINEIIKDRWTFQEKVQEGAFKAADTIIIVVLAENPYAEFMGDINSEFCQSAEQDGCLYNSQANEYQPKIQQVSLVKNIDPYEQSIINLVKQQDQNVKVITVLLSGRPMIINKALENSDAFIAAWLPGTTGGEAIVNSITGVYSFVGQSDPVVKTNPNRLPVQWLKSMDQVKNFPVYDSDVIPSIDDPLFEAGFGLSTQASSSKKQIE